MARSVWLLSDSAANLFRWLSWMTVIVFVVGVSVALILPAHEVDLGDSLSLRLAAWTIFGILALVVVGEWVLWVCMLWFSIRYDPNWIGKRLFWIAFQLIAFSLASAAVYFCAYRVQRAKLQQSTAGDRTPAKRDIHSNV
jgi:hypothetical protein